MLFPTVSVSIFIFLLIFGYKRYRTVLNPISALSIWYICILISSFRFSSLQTIWKPEEWLFLLIIPLFFIIPFLFAKSNFVSQKIVISDNDLLILKLFTIISFLIGTLVFSIEFLRYKEFPIFAQNTFDAYKNFGISYFHYFVNLLILTAGVAWILYFNSRDNSKFLYLLIIINCLLIFSLQGHRIPIVTILIGFLFIREFSYSKNKFHHYLIIFIIIVSIFGFIGQLKTASGGKNYINETGGLNEIPITNNIQKNEEKTTDKPLNNDSENNATNSATKENSRMNIPIIEKCLYEKVMENIKNKVNSSDYLSWPYIYIISNFENFIKYTREIDNYSYGIRSLYPVWAFTLQKAKFTSIISISQYRIFTNFTTFTYLWPFYGDFGILGAIIGTFVLGVLNLITYQSLSKKRYSVLNLLFAWLMFTFIVFMVFENLYLYPPFTFLFITIGFLHLLTKIPLLKYLQKLRIIE